MLRADVIERERARGHELIAAGVIRHFSSPLGRYGNVGVWSAADADERSAVLTGLPIWPYADIEVTR
ncbi:muconolactone Delta-isomerase family protein [Streptomyces sp. M19]